MSAGARFNLLLAKYGMVIGIGLLLVGLLAMGAAWNAWSDPPTDVVTEEIDREEFAVSTSTEADVVGVNTTLYREGETLVDMPVYFYDETPELRIIVETSVPDDQRVAVEKRLTVEIEAARDEQVFFSRTKLLEATEAGTSDGQVTMDALVNMSALADEVEEIRTGTRGIGQLETRLQLEVAYEGTQNEGELEATTDLVLAGQAYWLDEELEASETHTETESRTVMGERDMGTVAPLAAIGLLALVLAALSILGSRRGFDVEAIQTRLAHSEFDEWISAGRIPTRGDREYVSVRSLEDLVDIAIDSNKRVIHEDEIDAYAVVDADVVYYYASGDQDIEDWLEL